MKSDKTNQTRNDLLRELESLRAQLADPASAELNEDQIPLLIDRVEKAMSVVSSKDRSEETDIEPDAATGPQAGATARAPGQQTLFETAGTEKARRAVPAAPILPAARGDNPFLPKHIRDRLEERRQALADDIAQASTFFPVKPNPHKTATSPAVSPAQSNDQALVDELVAEYLPRIEAELRQRLMRRLDDENNDENNDSSENNSSDTDEPR